MPRLLTIRKTAWVNQFKPNVIRGKPLSPNAAVEERYYQELIVLIHKMTEETGKFLTRLFRGEAAEEHFAEDASITAQARVLTNALKAKYDALFATSATRIAESFANQSDKASSASLHSSIQQLSGGLSLPTTTLRGPLREILKATVTENVSLIKSISQKYLSGVQAAVMRSITTGNGLQDLVPYLADNKGVTLRRARFIAMDQTRKAFNNLSTARLENLGIEEAEWLHTGGSNHPRKTHIAMSGKTYKLREGLYDSAVGRKVKPGEEPGCRCRSVPIITFGGKKNG